MRKRKTLHGAAFGLCVAAFAAAASCGGSREPAPQTGSVPAGQTLYAQANFYLQARNELSALNYRAPGTLVPIGTRIVVKRSSDRAIACEAPESGLSFTFVGHRALAGQPLDQIFARFFAPEDPAERVARLTADEQKAVRAVEVTPGMSREAVLLSIGPPPSHTTPSLDASSWKYWNTRATTFDVDFDSAGKVTAVKSMFGTDVKP